MVDECGWCKKKFQEKELELSHDIPKYIGGTDKNGRHYLCIRCHNKYDRMILSRIFILVYKKIVYLSEDRRDYIPYMTLIKNENLEINKSKILEITRQIKQEVFGND